MDYEETSALMKKITTIRTLIVVASIFQWKIFWMDVKNSFLNEDLHEEVFHHQASLTNLVTFANFKNPSMVLNKHLMLGFKSFLQ